MNEAQRSEESGLTDLLVGWEPIETAPRDETVVELLVIHPNWYLARNETREKWWSVCSGYWTDFNKGGWVWTGLYGKVMGWKAAH